MIRERDKARKILNVIVEYFVTHDFKNISANVSLEETYTNINIKGVVNPISIDIDKLKKILNHPRVLAYDNYYDELLDSDNQEEIKIIGYLIDEAEVNLDNNLLTINLIRKYI